MNILLLNTKHQVDLYMENGSNVNIIKIREFLKTADKDENENLWDYVESKWKFGYFGKDTKDNVNRYGDLSELIHHYFGKYF